MEYSTKVKINGVELTDEVSSGSYITNVSLDDNNGTKALEIGATGANRLQFTLVNPVAQQLDGAKVEFYVKHEDDGTKSRKEELEEEVGTSTEVEVVDDDDTEGEDDAGEGEEASEEELEEAETESTAAEANAYSILEGEEATAEELTTSGEAEDEWELIGTYFIYSHKDQTEQAVITCYDGFMKMTDVFSSAKTTIKEVFAEFIEQMKSVYDIDVEEEELPNLTVKWKACTYRDAASIFAGLLGGYASFSPEGELCFSTYAYGDTILLKEELISYEPTSAGEIQIESVSCGNLTAGAGQGISFENAYADQSIVDAIYETYKGVRIEGARISTPWQATLQAGEFVRIMTEAEYKSFLAISNAIEKDGASEELQANLNSIGKIVVVSSQHISFGGEAIANIKSSEGTVTAAENPVPEVVFNKIRADYAKIEELEATNAKVSNLEAADAKIESLVANKADISELDATNAEITSLKAKDAEIEKVVATKVTAEEIEAEYAKLTSLNATNAKVSNLEANSITASFLKSNYLTAEQIAAAYIKASQVAADYADIGLANVSKADVGTLLANIGLITSATITNGHVTGYLDSVEINAKDITAGTLTVDRLVIAGTDKSIIYAINNSGKLTSTEVDTINGDAITKRTITADHIVAKSITANELAAGSVTAEKILAGSITAGKLAANSVESGNIKASSITADKLSITDLSAIKAKLGGFNVSATSIYSDNNNIILNSDGTFRLGTETKGISFNGSTVSIGNVKAEDVVGVSQLESVSDVANEALEQVETKANSSDVYTKAQSDANYDAKGAASTAKAEAISTASADATEKADTAQATAISTAAKDATTKAEAAKAEAAKDATTKADAAKNAAISTAAEDATTKAEAAAQTATNFITVDDSGAMVISRKNDEYSVLIKSNSVDVLKGTTTVASFGETASLGDENGKHTVVSSDGMSVYIGTTGAVGNKIAQIGYGDVAGVVNGQDVVRKGAYYDLGYRDNGSKIGEWSVAEGYESVASGVYSHAEGGSTHAEGQHSHAEGHSTTASGACSHAEGYNTTASGACSHAEGYNTTASGWYSHAEGVRTTASSTYSHAEGYNTTASSTYSHAEGYNTTASGACSHSQNRETIASGESQTAIGKYNVSHKTDNTALVIGNGSDSDNRSDALTVDFDGNVVASGEIKGAIRSATISGYSGSIRLYRFGCVVLCTASAFKTTSSNLANGKALSQTIPTGYRPCDSVYIPFCNTTTAQRLALYTNGTMNYFGKSAWSDDGYFSGCWMTKDD